MSYGKVIIDNTIVFAASVGGFVVGLGTDLALITFLGRLSNAELGTFLEINIPAFNFYIKGHDVNLYTAVIAGIYSGYHGCNYVTNNMVDRDLVALKYDILECLGNSNTDGIIET